MAITVRPGGAGQTKSSVGEAMSKQSSYKLSGIGLVTGFVFSLSGIINILALTGAFYMLQIYDRALTSVSMPSTGCSSQTKTR